VKLYLFDDRAADGWHPFSLSRPCCELLFGTMRLRQRIERFAGRPAAGCISRSWLGDFTEDDAPPVITDAAVIPVDGPRLCVSSRAVPDPAVRFEGGREPAILRMEDDVVGCYLPAGEPSPSADWLASPAPVEGWDGRPVTGRLLGEVWELVIHSSTQVAADVLAMRPQSTGTTPAAEVLGSGAVVLGRDVSIEPGVLLDTREGPILLGDRVEVRTGARIAGPFACGADCRLLGGAMSGVTAGPFSYIRGEVEETVLLGYTNKAHDGFLGHAYIGSWVNLGAMTTNSDLKNNYGSVRLSLPSGEVDTGIVKLGCLIGDHAKTGIGTLLNTGTVIGAGSNIFGGAMPPKWVPPFSWGSGSSLDEFREDAFLSTARIVMQRRGVSFDDSVERWLAAVWRTGRSATA
jgi:UDP-N-acetylglucosamine diphosphorylase/glucosamine-1-phosphate N-acetyltransferase